MTDSSDAWPKGQPDKVTLYGIEVREAISAAVRRATHDEAVQWCRDWIAARRAAGLGRGQNEAWKEFRNAPGHVGLSRDDAFRLAFDEAKTR